MVDLSRRTTKQTGNVSVNYFLAHVYQIPDLYFSNRAWIARFPNSRFIFHCWLLCAVACLLRYVIASIFTPIVRRIEALLGYRYISGRDKLIWERHSTTYTLRTVVLNRSHTMVGHCFGCFSLEYWTFENESCRVKWKWGEAQSRAWLENLRWVNDGDFCLIHYRNGWSSWTNDAVHRELKIVPWGWKYSHSILASSDYRATITLR